MKQQHLNTIKKQFTFLRFSRTQRRAIFFISVLATAGILILKSGMLDDQSNSSEQPFVATETNNALVARKINQPSASYDSTYTHTTYPLRKTAPEASFQSGTLSRFDPNTVSLEKLIAMGLREKAALTLINYRAKGGKFRNPEDLSKLYGWRAEEVEQLIPYVQIENETTNLQAGEAGTPRQEEAFSNATPQKTTNFNMEVDVNVADSLTWIMLPGIGAKRASSILKYRSKLGGFTSVDQVGETFGLPDSVFQKIKPFLHRNPTAMQQLSINEATETELKAHPYIPWQIAKIIVAYRTQHGPYKQVDDLLNIHIIQKDWLEKVRPYLKAGNP